jgi:hypothetical protein
MSASRSRQKHKLEPISLEELAGATGMSGFCSFLTRDASIPVPVLDSIQSSAPDAPAPAPPALDAAAAQTAAVQSPAPEIAPLELPPAETTAPESPALDSEYGQSTEPVCTAPESTPSITTARLVSAVEKEAVQTGALDSRYQRRPRIREAVTVADGHSLAEEAVYETMFREGKPYHGDSRILTIGLRTLAELSRMAYSNCKANVRSLVVKLALDELPGFSYTDGRTYIIYGRDEILLRRRAAGLTHVLRTRGVAFVDAKTGAPVSPASESPAL